MAVHELKILPEYYNAVRFGDKRFEIRKNDRDFHTGDILRLKEWDGEKYTGEELDVVVRWILFDWQDAIKSGYCIMSIDSMMHSIPRQPKTGHWIPWQPNSDGWSETFTCSYCRNNTKHPYPTKIPDEYLFCPYCGAKMEEQTET